MHCFVVLQPMRCDLIGDILYSHCLSLCSIFFKIYVTTALVRGLLLQLVNNALRPYTGEARPEPSIYCFSNSPVGLMTGTMRLLPPLPVSVMVTVSFKVTFLLQPLEKAQDQFYVYFCNCQLFRQKILLISAAS